MIYKNCSETPLYNFIKALLSGSSQWMDSGNGEATQETDSAWNDIYEEYGAITKNTKHTAVVELMKEITAINHKLDLIQSIVQFMTNEFDPELVTILKGMGFYFAYDPNSDHYDNDLKMTISSAKSMVMQKQEAEKELDKLNTGTKSATEQDYISLLTALSKFQGYRIDWKQCSVSEYVEILNSYQAQAENGRK